MDQRYCPKCKADLQGEPIPEEHRKHYAIDATHYLKWIGRYSLERDMTTHYKCPFCGHEEKRQ